MSQRRSGNVEDGCKRPLSDSGESSSKKSRKIGNEEKLVEVKIPNVAEMNGNVEEDDDLFGELNDTVNRKIYKCGVLEMNVYYVLSDIYSITVEERLSYVGGFKRESDEECTYIWLPAALSRNFTEAKVSQLKSSIARGKKGYVLYKGMKSGKYGMTYDISWVEKPKI